MHDKLFTNTEIQCISKAFRLNISAAYFCIIISIGNFIDPLARSLELSFKERNEITFKLIETRLVLQKFVSF